MYGAFDTSLLKHKSPKQLLLFGELLFLLRFLLLLFFSFLSFRSTCTCPRQISGTTEQNFMKLSGVIDMFLVGPKVFSFVVKGIKVIF